MDKAEPLKDRDIYAQYVQAEDFDVKGIRIFTDSAVKSAIEWYKYHYNIYHLGLPQGELRERYPETYELYNEYQYIEGIEFDIWLLNKAFEDVLKETEQDE